MHPMNFWFLVLPNWRTLDHLKLNYVSFWRGSINVKKHENLELTLVGRYFDNSHSWKKPWRSLIIIIKSPKISIYLNYRKKSCTYTDWGCLYTTLCWFELNLIWLDDCSAVHDIMIKDLIKLWIFLLNNNDITIFYIGCTMANSIYFLLFKLQPIQQKAISS